MLNELSKKVYEINKKNGFWEQPVETGTRIALMHSELSEALEADRHNHHTDRAVVHNGILDIMEDDLFKSVFSDKVKNTFEDELADTIIRILDYCGGTGIDIDFHVKQKLRYNSLREYKHGKQY